MQSALTAVPGVSKAVVDLASKEAHVVFDSSKVKPNDLVAAVANIPDSMGDPYAATVKK